MITLILFYTLLILNIFFTGIVIYNLLTAPKLKLSVKQEKEIFISVLIPARNEEKNISKILDDLLNQTYNNFEIIVLNDNSTDRTGEIVKSYSVNDSRIILINGKKLQDGWLGKNFACYQLAKKAKGELLLFIDADVRLNKYSIESAINLFYEKKVDMLSVFPTQVINHNLSFLITPMMNWILLTFLPLKFVYTSNNKSFVAANGQFILIKKNMYYKIGTHEKVKDKIVEDMELAKNVKINGGKIITALGNKIIFCKMYENFNESFKGFSKNFYPGFNTSALTFILLLIFFEFVFTNPIILSFFNIKFFFITALIITSRIVISYLSNQNIIINSMLHPFQMFLIFVIGINSILATHFGKREWKGRAV